MIQLLHKLPPSFRCGFLLILLAVIGKQTVAQSATDSAQAPLPPLFLIKTAPTLPFLGDDLNLATELSLGNRISIELTGGYHYRNPLLFWITSPLGPDLSLSAYENGWFVETAVKQYDVFGDPSAYLSYGLRYQFREYSREKYDRSWAFLSPNEDCLIESRTRRFGTFRGMWGKMYPIKNTRIVLEAYGGICQPGSISINWNGMAENSYKKW